MAEQNAGPPWRWLGAIAIIVGVIFWIIALLVAVAPRTSDLQHCGTVYQRSENSYSGGCEQAIEDGGAPVLGLAIAAGVLLLTGVGLLLSGHGWPAVGLVAIGVAAAVMYRYQWSSHELSYAPAAVFFVGALALIAACCDLVWLMGRLQRSMARDQSSEPVERRD